jgi:hypothetical protein
LNSRLYQRHLPQPISHLQHRFEPVGARIASWMAENAVTLLRVALGIVWFGGLKLVPGLSPAEDLVRATVPFLPGHLFLPFLGAWEILIGIGFTSGRVLRLTCSSCRGPVRRRRSSSSPTAFSPASPSG